MSVQLGMPAQYYFTSQSSTTLSLYHIDNRLDSKPLSCLQLHLNLIISLTSACYKFKFLRNSKVRGRRPLNF